eukprot:4753146-Pyramimonas_sp.AAC.1
MNQSIKYYYVTPDHRGVDTVIPDHRGVDTVTPNHRGASAERGAERVSRGRLVECSEAHACARPVEGA